MSSSAVIHNYIFIAILANECLHVGFNSADEYLTLQTMYLSSMELPIFVSLFGPQIVCYVFIIVSHLTVASL